MTQIFWKILSLHLHSKISKRKKNGIIFFNLFSIFLTYSKFCDQLSIVWFSSSVMQMGNFEAANSFKVLIPLCWSFARKKPKKMALASMLSIIEKRTIDICRIRSGRFLIVGDEFVDKNTPKLTMMIVIKSRFGSFVRTRISFRKIVQIMKDMGTVSSIGQFIPRS